MQWFLGVTAVPQEPAKTGAVGNPRPNPENVIREKRLAVNASSLGMQDLSGTLDLAITAATNLRTALRRRSERQVRNADERMLVKAASQARFKSYRPALMSLASEPLFRQIYTAFATLLECSDQGTLRARYVQLLASLRTDLVRLRSVSVLAVPTPAVQRPDSPIAAASYPQSIYVGWRFSRLGFLNSPQWYIADKRARLRNPKSPISRHRISFQKTADLRGENVILAIKAPFTNDG